jgi:hypothetical protein
MPVEVDFELIEKIKELLEAEMREQAIDDEGLALLLEDDPGYIADAIESLIQDVYGLITDFVSDQLEVDIQIIMDKTGIENEDAELTEEPVVNDFVVEYDEKIEWKEGK